MQTNENGSGGAPRPVQSVRRVGTVTMGLVLVAAGCAMLVSMFFPKLDLTVLLKASPVILISLGVETLLSARKGGQIRYDWVGMILCCLIVCTALLLFAAAWSMVNNTGWFQC